MNKTIPEMDVSTAEILGFIGLVLALSWLQFLSPFLEGAMSIEAPGGLDTALAVVFMLSPALAAVVLVARRSNARDAITFLRDRLRWRVSFAWYLVAFLLFPLLIGSASALYVLLGESLHFSENEFVLILVQVFTIGIVANLSENYGWRGYLQEGLQSTHSAFVASLAVGVVWGLWHAPLILVEDGPLSPIPFGWYMVLIVGLAVIFGWMYNETGGSVLLVTLLHCVFNASNGAILLPLYDAGADLTLFIALYAITIWLVIGALLLRVNLKTLTSVTAVDY